MTFDDFLRTVEKKWEEQTTPRDLRLGQLFFNDLCKVRPMIAEALRGTNLDPFYRDEISFPTTAYVKARWDS